MTRSAFLLAGGGPEGGGVASAVRASEFRWARMNLDLACRWREQAKQRFGAEWVDAHNRRYCRAAMREAALALVRALKRYDAISPGAQRAGTSEAGQHRRGVVAAPVSAGSFQGRVLAGFFPGRGAALRRAR